jgi:ParB/RepB/Spo0J family partition protein
MMGVAYLAVETPGKHRGKFISGVQHFRRPLGLNHLGIVTNLAEAAYMAVRSDSVIVGIRVIPLDMLAVDEYNVREDVGNVDDLVESIRKHGLINPLVVRPGQDGKYYVVCGSRRLVALKALGVREVECIVREMGDLDAFVKSYHENATAKTLSEEEKRRVYRRAYELAGRRIDRAAEMLRVSHQTIRNALDIDDVADEVMVVDRRSARASTPGQVQAVSKRVAREVGALKRRVKKALKKRSIAAEENTRQPSDNTQPSIGSLSGVELAMKLQWEPKTFLHLGIKKALHEVLDSPEGRVAVPSPEVAKMQYELVKFQSQLYIGFAPAVSLNPPLDTIKVLLCPSCLSPLRGTAKGAAVVCYECGFPNIGSKIIKRDGVAV